MVAEIKQCSFQYYCYLFNYSEGNGTNTKACRWYNIKISQKQKMSQREGMDATMQLLELY